MKAIKRTVAGLLATLMFATCFSFNFAFGADNYTDAETVAVSKVNAAGIMTGTDNGFEPSKTLTRAEAAAIVVRMKGVPESQVNGAKGNTIFTDVPASNWAAGYINAASAMGIISGVGNGLFLPEREVTIVEFAAMAIRALDAGKLVDTIGTWPTNYVNFATEEKLFEGVLKAYTAPATRMDVAFMVVNTIEANTWEKSEVTNKNEVTYVKTGKTILEDTLEITVKENEVVKSVDTKDRTVDFESNVFTNFDVAEGVEVATLKSGMEVDVWAKEDDKEIIRIAPAEKSKQAQVAFNGIEKIDVENEKITLMVDGKEKKYSFVAVGDAEVDALKVSVNTLEAPAEVTVNDNSTGSDASDDYLNEIAAHDDFFGTATLEGNKVTTLYVERYTNKGVVKEIKNDKIYFENSSKVKESNVSETIDMEDEDREYVVTKNGKEIDVTDIEKGDAVYYYVDANDSDRYVMVVNNYAVEGTAKQLSSTKYVKVDGKKYELSPSVADVDDLTAGDDVKLYLNGRSEIVMYQILDGAVDSTVAMVKSIRTAKDKYDKEQLEIVLVQLDGTELDVKEIDLKETAEKFDTTVDNDYDTEAELKTLWAEGVSTPSALVGTFVRYALKGGKVVIREFVTIEEIDSEDVEVTKSSYDKSKVVAMTEDEDSYNEKSGRLGEYILNEDTAIYVAKAESGAKADYAVKFEKVDFENLGTTPSGLTGYMYGINKDTNVVDAVLFTSSVSRSTDKNYAVVLNVETYADDSEDDYTEQLELLLNDGTVTEVLVKSDDAGKFAANDLIEAFIKDGKLDDYTLEAALADGSFATATYQVYTFNGETVKVLATDDSVSHPNIAENCIFVEYDDEETEYAKGSQGGIETIAESVTEYDADDKYDVTVYTVTNTDISRAEIVAIIYNKD